MNKENIIKFAIEKGWKCDPATGQVCSHTGKLIEGKGAGGKIYCGIIINNKQYNFYAHQLVWIWCVNALPSKPFVIDHKDKNPLNNSISNLRIVTNQENGFNSSAKGYCWHKNNKKWLAQITLNGETIHLGYFFSESEASTAYKNAKKIYHQICAI